jgi:2-polyprenyl-3-methyl-5-hydroxy-6-metoxy-1,4-benzoquinol methylase
VGHGRRILSLEIFTTLSPAYPYSEEQQLAVQMLRQRLPSDAPLRFLERGTRSEAEALGLALSARLADPAPLPEYFLFVREPWVFLANGCVPHLVGLLETQPRLACVLPSDQRRMARRPNSQYHTLRAFDKFAQALQTGRPRWQAYDGREPFLFLVRADVLRDLWPLEDLFALPALLGERTAIALHAYAHLPIDYYGERRGDILALVPESVTSLLDIGCAKGSFGALVKSQRTCRVVGIELNPVVAETARRCLDQVFIGDALQVDPGERFDCVTCLDILEHIAQPDKLVNRICHDFLQPGGYLIASIPNVGHWSIVADLLAGRWDYVPIGLLCVTHLRFFTLTTLRALLLEQGLQILHVKRVSDPPPRQLQRQFKKLARAGLELDLDNLTVMNYHIVACLPAKQSKGEEFAPAENR